MSQQNTLKKKLSNFFTFSRDKPSGMHTDLPISLQPENTYRNAWGISNDSYDERGGGVFTADADELCAKLPAGHILRGAYLLKDKDWHIVFSVTEGGGKSEIGYIDQTTCKYEKCINDDDLDGCKLDFGLKEWIAIEVKYLKNGTCFDVVVYWSVNTFYHRLNISTLDKVDRPIPCEELNLVKCHGNGTPTVRVSETGGHNVPAGAYAFCGQYEDEDGNRSNVYSACQFVSVGSPNNIPGERGENSIHVTFRDLHPGYSKLLIYAIKVIDGDTTAWYVGTKYYTTDGIEFIYRSESQDIEEIDINYINIKKNGYPRGYDLIQEDGHLILYNVLGLPNPDWQKYFMGLDVTYVIKGVPLEYAKFHKGLIGGEVYALSAGVNTCDGRRFGGFEITGRDADAYDTATVDGAGASCLECPTQRWQVESTAQQTDVYCDDIWEGSTKEEDIQYDYTPPIFTPNPTKSAPLNNSDGSGVPNEETWSKAQEQQKRQAECMCLSLVKVFMLFAQYDRKWFDVNRALPPPMHVSILSDPVSIVGAYCQCAEMASQGGAEEKKPRTQDEDRDGSRGRVEDQEKPQPVDPLCEKCCEGLGTRSGTRGTRGGTREGEDGIPEDCIGFDCSKC